MNMDQDRELSPTHIFSEYPSLEKDLESAVNKCKAWKGVVRIVSHYDADGLSAGAILFETLSRSNIPTVLHIVRGMDEKVIEYIRSHDDNLIIADLGSSDLDKLHEIGKEIIILDHHQINSVLQDNSNVMFLNFNNYGINGTTEGCASTMAYLFSIVFSEKNYKLLAGAVVGICGDRQHMNPEGINKKIIEFGVSNNIIKYVNDSVFSGSNIYDGIFYMLDPYVKSLTGKAERVEEMLNSLDIKFDEKYTDMSHMKKKYLRSLIVLEMLRSGLSTEHIMNFQRDIIMISGVEEFAEELADLVDFTGRHGEYGLATETLIHLFDGKRNPAVRLEAYRKDFQKMILEELNDMMIKEYEYIYVVENKIVSISGILASETVNYIVEKDKPVISMALSGDVFNVSARATSEQVKRGVNLAATMSSASADVKGSGGGHPIAAGATVPANMKDKFIEKVNYIIGEQISGSWSG